MRDDRNPDMPLIVELGADELEAVSAGETDTAKLMQTISSCLRMMHDVRQSIIANVH